MKFAATGLLQDWKCAYVQMRQNKFTQSSSLGLLTTEIGDCHVKNQTQILWKKEDWLNIWDVSCLSPVKQCWATRTKQNLCSSLSFVRSRGSSRSSPNISEKKLNESILIIFLNLPDLQKNRMWCCKCGDHTVVQIQYRWNTNKIHVINPMKQLGIQQRQLLG